ncbi:hypothetical protein B0T17DRAFT_535339 [Bombardia bombarda]|uniref:Uncharacterized protein n=1 Tax=Bombardia bombarda TaxID=252184 RepID=A0AA39WUN7_9PEZI|nr:hypothetical protein B0T17DRAFT_535339 [Bombardia bombarda]
MYRAGDGAAAAAETAQQQQAARPISRAAREQQQQPPKTLRRQSSIAQRIAEYIRPGSVVGSPAGYESGGGGHHGNGNGYARPASRARVRRSASLAQPSVGTLME